jgi:hypothetical protein
MRGIEAQRAAIRRLVLQQLGLDFQQPRGFAGQANTLGMEAQLLRLPASQAAQVDLQDSTTGDPFFMADASIIDGDHLIQ